MRLSEVFLRLGCSLVGWMMLYAHFVWLAALGRIGCGPEGAELHGVLLGFVPITIASAFALRLTRPFGDIHRILRWLGLPVFGLIGIASYNVWEVTSSVYATGHGFCSTADADAWHYLWGPAQLLTTIVVAALVIRVWQSAVAKTST
ncbi:MAG: hypothetical protein P8Y61_14060 [Gammaproteobacteria bacterium]|jgi:hypothetical protein